MRKQNIILTCILVVLAAALLGLYIWGIVHDGKPFTEDLTKFLLVFVAIVSSLLRINTGGGRKPLSVYEKFYQNEIDGAFEDDTLSRKKLLCALRLYCEDNYNKSLKYLLQLRGKCKTHKDVKVLRFFTAVVLSDAGLVNEAIYEYLDYLEQFPRNSTVLSNLGLLYGRIGDMESAEACLRSAIESDRDNAYAYLNLASHMRKEYNLDEAEMLAKKALELKPDLYQAATQLACIYAAKGDTESQKKYYQIAIAKGENAGALKKLIDDILLGEEEKIE